MKSLQQTVDAILEREWPLKICADLLYEKHRAQNIELSKAKLNVLAPRVLDGTSASVDFAVDEPALSGIQIEFTEEDGRKAEERMQQLSNSLPGLLGEMTVRGTEVVLESMKRRWPEEARAQKRDLDRFRRNLNLRWGPGLERLRMLCTISRELGSGINNALRPAGGGDRPLTFDLLIRLHARACQITEEVICLLGSGFADGAMARWRTMHEIAAVACLLEEHGESLSERYRRHEIVEARKAARQYRRFEAQLHIQPMDDQTVENIEKDYKEAIGKFGAAFGNSYGWAAEALGKENPTIADIQASAKIQHLSPYYRLASHNVHANPKGIFHGMGLLEGATTLLAGPSNAGLADPAHSTAISLLLISAVLLKLHPTLDNTVAVRAMDEIMNEIGELVQDAHEKLERDDEAFRCSEKDVPAEG